MNYVTSVLKAAMIAAVCFLVAACSQTSISTYSGKIGGTKLTTAQIQKKKIAASRLRAKRARIARREAFIAKRDAARKARKSARKSSKKSIWKKKKRKTVKRSRVKRKVAKRSRLKRKVAKRARYKKKSKYALKRKNKKKLRKRKVASRKALKRSRKVAKSIGKKRRLKRTSAYVGSVSRKAAGLNRNGKRWNCVPKSLKKVINQIRRKYGRVTINSTWRSKRHNRRVGGKRRSMHLHCRAIDFRVHGRTRGLTRWLSRHPLVGGYKRYPSGYYHIDNGPRRTW